MTRRHPISIPPSATASPAANEARIVERLERDFAGLVETIPREGLSLAALTAIPCLPDAGETKPLKW